MSTENTIHQSAREHHLNDVAELLRVAEGDIGLAIGTGLAVGKKFTRNQWQAAYKIHKSEVCSSCHLPCETGDPDKRPRVTSLGSYCWVCADHLEDFDAD